MKTIKTLMTAAALVAGTAAVGGQANAAIPENDFRFDYDPALLSSMAGRVELRESLKLEARDYCRRHTQTRQSMRMERRCQHVVIDDALRQLSASEKVSGDRLEATGASYSLRDHCTGRARR
ncbi:UrcA family protein [Henriciella aquimarina]|uniref:UrcA family protein n=1 Tax=Henriciella aquimarina TaxID=545261 RepID=UPI001301D745|nr:UrcA family protein [Henriciella aquimarina]